MREFCRLCRDRVNEAPPTGEPQEVNFADFIVWGKLFPPEALGPRCYDCAAGQIGHHALTRAGSYAVYDLRPVNELLAAAVQVREATEAQKVGLGYITELAGDYGVPS